MLSAMTWKRADDISDQIVDLVNRELVSGAAPTEIFAGQMLAMMALLKTCEGLPVPRELQVVRSSVELCLHSMLREKPR